MLKDAMPSMADVPSPPLSPSRKDRFPDKYGETATVGNPVGVGRGSFSNKDVEGDARGKYSENSESPDVIPAETGEVRLEQVISSAFFGGACERCVKGCQIYNVSVLCQISSFKSVSKFQKLCFSDGTEQ